MADKAKHAHGSRKNLEAAIANKVVDAYDVLFLSGEDEAPAIGWVDKNGLPIIIENTDISGVEAELATKANAAEMEEKIGQAVTDSVASAKSYTDGKIEAAIAEHLVKKFEITSVPEGTLVDYRNGEIRVMCPENSQFVKQAVGATGDPNCYYATFKTYVFDDNVVGYKEYMGAQADSEIQTTFSTDQYGRRFQTTWLALARYDESTDTWTYYGKSSSEEKFIGWDYRIDWYDANGIVIASDCVRINLTNENCHSGIKPYYVGGMMKDIETMVDERIAAVNSAYEVIEF